MSWSDPREDEGADPMIEGDVDDPDEVDTDEDALDVDEDEAQP